MTVVLAILLALGVPFAQLHTVNDRVTCCCPDPDHCKCPDHQPDNNGQTAMGTCHKRAPQLSHAQHLPPLVAPAAVAVVAPARLVVRMAHVLVSPHEPPVAERPDAPS